LPGVHGRRGLRDATGRHAAALGCPVRRVRREWEAKIIDQTPDSHIAWEGGPEDPSGSVIFESLGADRTLITLSMEYEPQGTKERIGDVLGGAKRRIRGDLERFEQYIERRGVETGAWRGNVEGGRAMSG
jgi:uncharacterized membrane protein